MQDEGTFNFNTMINTSGFDYVRLKYIRPKNLVVKPKRMVELSPENVKILSYIFDSLSSG
jgi:hypothetical protein